MAFAAALPAIIGAAGAIGGKILESSKPAQAGGVSDSGGMAAAPAPATPVTQVNTDSGTSPDLSSPDLQGEAQRLLGQQQALPAMAQAPQLAQGEIPHPSSQMAPQAPQAAQFTAPEAPAHPPQAIAQMQKWMIDWSAFE